MKNNKKHICILFREGYLSVAPSVLSVAKFLASKDYVVSILSHKTSEGFAEYKIEDENIRVFQCDSLCIWINSYHAEIELPATGIFAKLYRKFVNHRVRTKLKYYFSFSSEEQKSLKSQYFEYREFCRTFFTQYDIHRIIAIDTVALAICDDLTVLKKTIYYSLEILFYRDLFSGFAKHLKRIERRAASQVLCTIIQDKYRKEALYAENQTSDRIPAVFMPNSPDGKIHVTDSNYFRKMFSISENKKILLIPGMISPAFHSYEIAKAFVESPLTNDFVLVFHERIKVTKKSEYLLKIENLKHPDIYFSLTPLPYNLIDNVFTSCDIGIISYNELYGLNYSLISGASGKLAHFFKCGKPVICKDLPGFREILGEYSAGLTFSEHKEIMGLSKEIMHQYDSFSLGSKACFNDKYEFSKNAVSLIPYMS